MVNIKLCFLSDSVVNINWWFLSDNAAGYDGTGVSCQNGLVVIRGTEEECYSILHNIISNNILNISHHK